MLYILYEWVYVYGRMCLAKGGGCWGCCIWMDVSSEGGRMLGVVVYESMYLAKGGGCWELLYMDVCI